MKKTVLLVQLAALAAFSGCASNSKPSDPGAGTGSGDPAAPAVPAVPSTKDAARAGAGKADGVEPVDVCAANGWYGDGECDTFCARPDTDCGAASGCEAGPPAQNTHFKHNLRSPAITVLGSPAHSLSDGVGDLGQDVALTARFRYGRLGMDLNDEGVSIWARTSACGDWDRLGDATTDDEGRVHFTVPGDLFAAPGRYPVSVVVDGDGSRADGAVFVVAAGQPTVVFDIDGTLTTSDSELFQELFTGSTPDMWPGASDVANAYATAGYLPVFLTGRPESWTNSSRAWLTEMGFPTGVVRTTDRKAQVLPTRSGVGEFKRTVLLDLEQRPELRIVAAYGNAPTDICAYAQAGIDPKDTFIIGPHAGEACDGGEPTQALADYRTQLSSLADLPPAN